MWILLNKENNALVSRPVITLITMLEGTENNQNKGEWSVSYCHLNMHNWIFQSLYNYKIWFYPPKKEKEISALF